MNPKFRLITIALAGIAVGTTCLLARGANAQTPSTMPLSPATRITIEPAAMTLIKKVDAKMAALKTYRAEWVTKESDRWNWGTPHTETYNHRARVIGAKPNRLRYEVLWQGQATGETARIVSVYDGKTHWQQSENSYRATPRSTPPPLAQLRGFYATEDSFASYIAQDLDKGSRFGVSRRRK